MTNLQKREKENVRDAALILQHRNGSTIAFTTLANLHRSRLTSFNYSILHNHPDAEDATQEIFLIVFNSFANGKYIESLRFGGWLLLTARYYLSHLLRKNTLLDYVDILPEQKNQLFPEDDFFSPHSAQLSLEIEKLSKRDKKILKLRFWKKQSWAHIGTIMKITENSASGQYAKILKKLKKGLEHLKRDKRSGEVNRSLCFWGLKSWLIFMMTGKVFIHQNLRQS